MSKKRFGDGMYTIMPVNDIDACDKVFEEWIESANINQFPKKLTNLYCHILQVIKASNVENCLEYGEHDLNRDITKALGHKTFELARQFDNTHPKDSREIISLKSRDFDVLITITKNMMKPTEIQYQIGLDKSDKTHIIVEAEGKDIADLKLTSFIPGYWIDKFTELNTDLEHFKDPIRVEKYKKMAAFQEEFADFGILDNGM